MLRVLPILGGTNKKACLIRLVFLKNITLTIGKSSFLTMPCAISFQLISLNGFHSLNNAFEIKKELLKITIGIKLF